MDINELRTKLKFQLEEAEALNTEINSWSNTNKAIDLKHWLELSQKVKNTDIERTNIMENLMPMIEKYKNKVKK